MKIKIIAFLFLIILNTEKLSSQLNISYESTFELKNGYKILKIALTNNGSGYIVHTSKQYIQKDYIFRCLIDRNMDFLASYNGDVEAFRNLHLDASRVKSDTLQVNKTLEITFKYKIKYCLSNSFFVLRVFDPGSMNGKKIYFPLEEARIIKEEPILNYSD